VSKLILANLYAGDVAGLASAGENTGSLFLLWSAIPSKVVEQG